MGAVFFAAKIFLLGLQCTVPLMLVVQLFVELNCECVTKLTWIKNNQVRKKSYICITPEVHRITEL